MGLADRIGPLTRVVRDPVLIGLVLLLVVLLSVGGFWLVSPLLEQLTRLDREIALQEKALREKQEMLAIFRNRTAQLKKLPATVRVLGAGESPQVVALAQSQQVVDIARERGDDDTLSVNSPDRDANRSDRRVLSLAPRGDTLQVVRPADPDLPRITLYRYQYELILQGTYVTLADFVNRLTQADRLVTLDKIVITKVQDSRYQMAPLEMALTFSVYLHDPALPAATSR